MSLLTDWRKEAYEKERTDYDANLFWKNYFEIEKGIYSQILSQNGTPVTGTVKGLAEKFGTDISIMTGFLDGINDSLKTPNPIEEMTEDTEVSLDFDKEKLYYNMVGAKADWLYNIPSWKNILTDEKRQEITKEYRDANIAHSDKIGRNHPCPCGSGKKYKNCCGKKG